MSTYAAVTTNGITLTITIPDDGKTIEAADVNVPLCSILDSIARLTKNGFSLDASGAIAVNAPSGIAEDTVSHSIRFMNPSAWNAFADGKYSTASVTGEVAYLEFSDIPDGVTLKTVQVWIDPANGHSSVPGSKPSIGVYLLVVLTGTHVFLGSRTDISITVPAYETPHAITAGTFSNTYLRSRHRLVVELTTESGLHAVGGGVVIGAICSYQKFKLS